MCVCVHVCVCDVCDVCDVCVCVVCVVCVARAILTAEWCTVGWKACRFPDRGLRSPTLFVHTFPSGRGYNEYGLPCTAVGEGPQVQLESRLRHRVLLSSTFCVL